MAGVIIVADTCAIIHAYDETHPRSEACMKVLDSAGALVISPLVLDEVDHMARKEFGYEASVEIAEDFRVNVVSGRYIIPTVTAATLAGAANIRARYKGLQLDLSDAVSMTLAAQYDTDMILTTDFRDFRSVVPLSTHTHFRLLPEDL
ncbi:PIN domain-containing protein [Streptomyces sp. NPDC006450]|uniref:type II toxin-antitoxin system VapC family toxin n=1 Tax=Streptomyces sp. NPDC006450 TaxID=3155458 RepID=UPI0033A6B9F8